jgi:23S rRNA (cytosine1962-C5)-methyltransferase
MIKIFCAEKYKNSSDYELLDTGEGEKLERFGPYTFVRPYEDAVWKKTLSKKDWENADGKFLSSKAVPKAGWKFPKEIQKKWEMQYGGIKFTASPTPFRHLSFFPEQASHWEFIEKQLALKQENFSPLLHPSGGTFRLQNSPVSELSESAGSAPKLKFLNLFGYTGVASLFALRAGAEVTHVDASKQSLNMAKENQKLSGMENLPMRIIEDDVIKFLEREVKRGNKYDAVIMDPPKFGRGPKGETWKLEDMLPRLLSLVQKVLSDNPIFVILTSYATDSSALSLGYALESMFHEDSGVVEAGELCVLEKSNDRLISLANTAVWSKI